MKTIKNIAIMTILVIAVISPMASQAQLRFGPKVGLNVNSLHFNESTFDASNRVGFNAGLMAEFTVPVIGVGADISAMYVRRSAEIKGQPIDKREYIEIPVNLKWKINIPVVASIVKPYLTTGPSFAFLTSKESFREFRNKKTDVAWNFGFGVELLKHLQVGASYGIGMTKAFKSTGLIEGQQNIDAKNRYWTVTAAYLF